MALTNEDIDERFEIDARGVVRWKRVSAKGLPRWCVAKAEEINRKAGEPVHFFPHQNGGMVVKLYGGTVSESRVRKVLQRQTAQDVAVSRERAAAKRGPGVKSAAAMAETLSPKVMAWSDPMDPEPSKDDRAAWDAWSLREFDRAKAWQAK